MLAVVLSGGGANGAYEVGALYRILQHYKPDAYCGTSVGAINSAFLAQYPKENSYDAARHLLKLWLSIDTSSIYKLWYGGFLWYLPALWKGSVYNTKPVRDLIAKNLDTHMMQNSGVQLRVVGVSLNTGECMIWKEYDADIVQGVQASSSYPIFFSPIHARRSIYSDGGLRNITPLKAAIDLGATEIIVITCSPQNVSYSKSLKPSTLAQVERTLDIMCNEINRDDMKKAEIYNDLVRAQRDAGRVPSKREIKIHVVQPENALGDSLDFSPKKNEQLMELGRNDAKAVFESLW
jgi:NTE family protein